MMVAVVSLLVVTFISLLVTRLAAMALMFTGLSQESTRFQARSALSGVGFTTQEAESVVNHPVRRRIIMGLMLTGSIGMPTVIATVVVSVITTVKADHWWHPALLLLVGGGALFYFGRSRRVSRWMNNWMSKGLKRWTRLEVKDYISLLQLRNGYAVTELLVESHDWLDGKSLKEAALPREGVLVLGIQDENNNYQGTPRAEDVIKAGDILILYGPLDRIKELDERKAFRGESAHQKAVNEQAEDIQTGPSAPTA